MQTPTSAWVGGVPAALPVPADARQLESLATLPGGERIRVRAMRADDTARLRAFHAGLSLDTIVFRFFRALPVLSEEMAQRFTHIDYENRMALVATTGDGAGERILGVVRYDRTGPETAEVAFVVADAWQGRGISTLLLHRLAAYARQRGMTTLVAITMASNMRMQSMLRHCGFPVRLRYAEGDIEISLDITQPPHFSPAPWEPRAPAAR